jgi:mannose-1-phosphate guanylyltransferase
VAEAAASRSRRVPSPALTAIVLAGGSGTRFWPLSRRHRPKQFLALEGERTLLQSTVDRLSPLIAAPDLWISTTVDLAAEALRQLPEVPAEQTALEPAGRNTAPAIGWAVRSLPAERRRGVVVVLPADHRVADPPAFRRALEAAIEAVRAEDLVVTLGVVPRWAETGYGYLKLGAELGGHRGVELRRVSRFVEKPDRKAAQRYHRSGAYLWNAGIFVFRGATLLRHLKRLEPALAQGIEAMAREPGRVGELYPGLPSISIDHAVMERLRRIGTVPLDCGWSDLGSWAALSEVLPHDPAGNATMGDGIAVDAERNLIFSDPASAGPTAVLGVRDLVVVRTADAVLVAPKARSQEVRRLLAELESRGRRDVL